MSDLLYVNGGNPLSGEITVRGAKNFVSKAMVAALLGEGPSVLRNVPQIKDVAVVTGLLELHGVSVQVDDGRGNLAQNRVEQGRDVHAGLRRIESRLTGASVGVDRGKIKLVGVGRQLQE